jgi:hypothetical protein
MLENDGGIRQHWGEIKSRKKGDFFCWVTQEQWGHQTTLKTCQMILTSVKKMLRMLTNFFKQWGDIEGWWQC